MIKYLVIGDPVEHSLSPQMQNTAFEIWQLGPLYGKKQVKENKLSGFAAYARENLLGFNITVPHKQNIMQFLDEIDDEARLADSVNTVKISDGRMKGFSTDGIGLRDAFRERFKVEITDGSFCFIGCGGAARAAAFYFASHGAKNLFFANRTVAKAQVLASELEKYCQCSFCAIDDKTQLEQFIAASDVLIQGTSLGLKLSDPLPFAPELLDLSKCYYDLIYGETRLLKTALAKGLKCADGSSMLLHQGAASFEIWTELKAPVEAMRYALAMALKERDKH